MMATVEMLLFFAHMRAQPPLARDEALVEGRVVKTVPLLKRARHKRRTRGR